MKSYWLLWNSKSPSETKWVNGGDGPLKHHEIELSSIKNYWTKMERLEKASSQLLNLTTNHLNLIEDFYGQ